LTIPNFSGGPSDNLADWEAAIERDTVADDWTPEMKRRVAIGKLSGAALAWHDQTGVTLLEWGAWIAGLRTLFRPRLSISEWCTLVETRRQLPTESGVIYAMEKLKFIRLCPGVELPEADTIPYLIRGLNRPEIAAALLARMPNNITDLIEFVRQLEQVGLSFSTVTHTPVAAAAVLQYGLPPAGHAVPQTAVKDYLSVTVKALANQMSLLASTVHSMANQHIPNWRVEPSPSFPPSRPIFHSLMPKSPDLLHQSIPQVPRQQIPQQSNPAQYYNPYPRRPLNELLCFACNNYGHFAKDCPHNIAAANYYQGNEEADLLG